MQPSQNPNIQPTPERPLTPGGERNLPSGAEAAPTAPQGASQPAAMPQIPVVPPQQGIPVAPGTQVVPTPTANPTAAGDGDVIEKEWVDQANKVIEQTKNDPYTEEEAVESLQQDYLKKRYGHDVKKPGQQ